MSPDLPAPPLAPLVGAEHLLVGCDFDGTLAPIREHPADVRLPPGAWSGLSLLSTLPRTTVAIVSGRALAELAGLIDVPAAWLIGSHGAERRAPGSSMAEEARLSGVAPIPDWIVDRIRGLMAPLPPSAIEEKPAGLAIHLRGATGVVSRTDLDSLADLLAAIGEGQVRILRGRGVLEVVPRWTDKGTAFKTLWQERHRGAVRCFLGDDVTDEDVFRALLPDGIGILVADEASLDERPGPTSARYMLPGPESVGRFLQALASSRARALEQAAAGPGPVGSA